MPHEDGSEGRSELLCRLACHCGLRVTQTSHIKNRGAGEGKCVQATSTSLCFHKIKKTFREYYKVPNKAGSMDSLGPEQGEQESSPLKFPKNPTWKGAHCHLRQTALPCSWTSPQASEGLFCHRSVFSALLPITEDRQHLGTSCTTGLTLFPQKPSSPKQT